MTRVAIIADDLTGALDTASPFACRGAKTICFTEPEAINFKAAAGADVISVSTNSRNLPPDHADAKVKAAAESILALSPDIVLKKIDSRLKGNVAVECDAVAAVFGRDHLLVVPAAPDVGRYVMNGAVNGAGVAQPINVLPVVCRQHLPDQDSGRRLARGYAECGSVIHDGRGMLPVCSRGFAVALAEHLYPDRCMEKASLNQPWLVAIGSRDTVTIGTVHSPLQNVRLHLQ